MRYILFPLRSIWFYQNESNPSTVIINNSKEIPSKSGNKGLHFQPYQQWNYYIFPYSYSYFFNIPCLCLHLLASRFTQTHTSQKALSATKEGWRGCPFPRKEECPIRRVVHRTLVLALRRVDGKGWVLMPFPLSFISFRLGCHYSVRSLGLGDRMVRRGAQGHGFSPWPQTLGQWLGGRVTGVAASHFRWHLRWSLMIYVTVGGSMHLISSPINPLGPGGSLRSRSLV